MVHDPFVRQDDVGFDFTHDFDLVVKNADAVIIITAHQMYKDLDLNHIKSLMSDSPILIDGRKTLDPEKVLEAGFIYRSIGRGQYIP